MKTTATALQSLEVRARTQGDGVAVLVSGGAHRSAVTWTGLLDEVEVCAAGLARAGLHAGQVVLGAMAVDVRALVLQHAVRTVGATLLWVHPGVGPAELEEALDGAPVRFAVVDDESRLAAWGGLDLRSADVLRMDGDGLAPVRALGAERLQEAPSQIRLLDHHADPQVARPRMLSAGSGVHATVVPAQPSTLTPADTVLLLGDMADPHVQDAIAQHLASGSALALVRGTGDLADVLSVNLPEGLDDSAPFAPTVLRLARPADLATCEELFLLPAREVPLGDPDALPRRRPQQPAEGFTNQGLVAPPAPA